MPARSRWLLLLACLAAGAPAGAAANTRPATIPAVQTYHPLRGAWSPSVRTRLILAGPGAQRAAADGRLLAQDLSLELHRPVHLVRSPPLAGDVVLRLTSRDARLGAEGYRVLVGSTLTIQAPSTSGLLYGGMTLLQLLRDGHRIRAGTIVDRPRYPERGLMLDLGRRVYPLAWLEAFVDEMSYLKLNLLHLHVSDDQRWGIVLPRHPGLASPGALTVKQLKTLLGYAAARHVQVFPEVDLPGHAGSILRLHPEFELKAAAATKPPPSPDSRKLDISSPKAVAYADGVIEEVLGLFPASRYFDIGGDEYVTPEAAPAYPQLGLDAKRRYGPAATYQDELLGFFNGIDRLARARGKRLRAWNDDLMAGAVLKPRRDMVVEWWTDFSPLSEPRPPSPEQLIAAGEQVFNGGWFPNYYTGDIGPIQGKPSPAEAYETWSVNQFCSAKANDHFVAPCYTLPRNSPSNLGASIDAWDDHDLTLQQIAAGLYPRLRVLAQKTWDSPQLTASYRRFSAMFPRLGQPPGYRDPR